MQLNNQTPKVFTKPRGVNENINPEKPVLVVRSAEEWNEIAREKNKKNAENLLKKSLEDNSAEIVNEAHNILVNFLAQHDPDLHDIYIGDANMIEDFYFPAYDAKHLDSYCGGCEQRSGMYMFILPILCDYLEEVANGAPPLSNDRFDAFLRVLQGWPDNKTKALPEEYLIKNKYREYTRYTNNTKLRWAVYEEVKPAIDGEHLGFLCRHYPKYAEKAKEMLISFLEKHGYSYYRIGRIDTPFKEQSAARYCTPNTIVEQLCLQMSAIEKKKCPPQSQDDWDMTLKRLIGMAQII